MREVAHRGRKRNIVLSTLSWFCQLTLDVICSGPGKKNGRMTEGTVIKGKGNWKILFLATAPVYDGNRRRGV